MKYYDLRSDTVTKPTPGMRKAIYEAEVGDDVYGEDPSVNLLQDMAADITGKEAALFVSTGSMGNLIPIYILCGRGNELIAHENSHILHYEMASVSALAGSLPIAVKGERGIVKPEAVIPKIRKETYSMPRTTMIEVENTHNLECGSCYSQGDLSALASLARSRNLTIHMDGARVFNASCATGMRVKDIATYAHTITFCLSKGLGAPAGSLLCGTKEFIAEARRVRKLLGGGMRQAGILAAAGIYALTHHVERLAEDHVHAKMIATTLAATSWARIDPDRVETNIVYFDTPNLEAHEVAEKLKSEGILCNATGRHTLRMVTHLDISAKDMCEVCAVLASIRL